MVRHSVWPTFKTALLGVSEVWKLAFLTQAQVLLRLLTLGPLNWALVLVDECLHQTCYFLSLKSIDLFSFAPVLKAPKLFPSSHTLRGQMGSYIITSHLPQVPSSRTLRGQMGSYIVSHLPRIPSSHTLHGQMGSYIASHLPRAPALQLFIMVPPSLSPVQT